MKAKILIFSLFTLLFIGCEKTLVEDSTDLTVEKELFTGYVQKGPFVNGASVTIAELDTNLNQTGKNYSTTISDNKGSFEQKQITLISKYVQLKADGYYFNEIDGKLSSGQLTLYALSDISDVNSANINLLTHLEKNRVEYLVKEKSMLFAAAKKQAQKEILGIFNMELSENNTSENMNIAVDGESNAMILALSVILQGTLTTAELSELLGNIITDIKTDGVLNNQKLGSALIDNARLTDLAAVRVNLTNKYKEMGEDITLPNFEKYVLQFIEKTEFIPEKKITYPTTGSYGENLLNEDFKLIELNYLERKHLSFRAELPAGMSLKIRLSGSNGVRWSFEIHPSAPENWKINPIDFKSSTQELQSIENGKTCELKIGVESGGIIKVEYFENGAVTPTFTKEVLVKTAALPIKYPYSTSNGINILSDSLNFHSTQANNTYDLAATLPFQQKLKIVLKGNEWIQDTSAEIPLYGWTVGAYNSETKSQEFTSGNLYNLYYAIKFPKKGTTTIEYYVNEETTPSKTKTIVNE